MTTSLQIDDLRIAYAPPPAAPAVDGFSMALQDGEIACLLGPSGCGKTSVLRAIAGFEIAQQGRIALGGSLLSGPGVHLPPEQRRVGMMFQEMALFPHLDAARNVGFGLRRWTRERREARVAEMLELVGLSDHGARYPHELSGGQQQRVALARALAPSPALLLLDEPFSNLDRATRDRLTTDVRRILRSAGQAGVLVTHDEAEAYALSDRIGRMDAGRVGWQAAHQ